MFQRSNVLRAAAILLCLILLPAALYFSAQMLGDRADDESRKLAEQSIRRAAVQCYALEGAYPVSWDHLKEVYGVTVDESRYFVDYQYVASNLMPDITVLPLTGLESPTF